MLVLEDLAAYMPLRKSTQSIIHSGGGRHERGHCGEAPGESHRAHPGEFLHIQDETLDEIRDEK